MVSSHSQSHPSNSWLTRLTVDTGIESYEPSASAIKQHIDTLRKIPGNGAAGGGTPRAKATATPKATPKKFAAVKTPKSSAKRKRVSHSYDEDEAMDDAEEDFAAEREMLKATPSGPRSTLSRRSKSVAKTYNEDDESDDEFATPQNNTRAATHTSAAVAGEEEQPGFCGGGAYDGAGEEVDQMDGIATGVAGRAGTLTPQGKTVNGNVQANSAVKRAVELLPKRAAKRKVPVDDNDGSEFTPDFM